MSLKFSAPLPSVEGISLWVGDGPTNANLKGKPVFVQFWAVSCGYCLMNAPLIAGWKERYSEMGLVLLSVHAGHVPDAMSGEVVNAIERHGILTPCALDSEGLLSQRFGTDGICPHYFFFDSTHRLRSRAAGMQGLHLVEASIRRCLGLPELTVSRS